MLLGSLVSTVGRGMIWPFLMLYTSEKTGATLTAVGMVLTVEAIAGVISSVIAGPIIDRVGRKWIMVISLLANGIGLLLMIPAQTYVQLFVIIVARGALNPLYDNAANAMTVDLVASKARMEGFSLARLVNNLGIAIGPAIGGFLITRDYSIALFAAFVMLASCGVFFVFVLAETLPRNEIPRSVERLGGYDHVVRDHPFLSFMGAVVLMKVCTSVFWMMLSLYMKQDFTISERLYGFLPMVNAILVIMLQMPVSARMKLLPRRKALFLGAGITALAVGSIFFDRAYWMFLGSMILFTIGEVIFEPTSTAEAADLSPEAMRGRYMGLFGMAWYAGQSMGPAMGGAIGDRLGTTYMWLGAGVVGAISALVFLLAKRPEQRVQAEQAGL